MSTISSTGSAYGTLSTYQLLTSSAQAQETSQTQATDTATGSVTSKDTDQAKVSQFGQLMSKLQQMSTSDPQAFTATAQTIAGNLAQSAQEATDPGQKAAFTYMADKFAEAAETGDMESLKDIASGPPSLATAQASGGSSGSDTVTISTEGKDLASQDNSTSSDGSSSSGTSGGSGDSAESGSTGEASSSSGSVKSGAASGGSSSSSSTEDTVEEIEEQIEEMEQKIREMEKKVQQAEQQAKADASKMDKVKNLNTQLADLNSQLAQLQTEKLEAQENSSSSS
ncbi:FlxA-like family protein [Fundidesulfovibrio putealis]|uniref:FlxA-like family protein n=1 Tax=Fundidesulfovibrio putealis TaxID=270496 RepID=UPI000419143E|nr:hypothetical protein [Fundidesulfovibrio putealis]